MAILVSVTADDRTHLTAVFDAPMDALTVRADGWAVAPVGTGAQVSVVRGTLQAGGLVCSLLVSPPLSAGETYLFIADKARTAAGAALVADSANAVATSEALETEDTAVLPLQAAFVSAVADEIQRIGGAPTTRTVDEFLDGDSRLAVESTLAFPAPGRLWYQGRSFRYQLTEPSRFDFVVEDPVSPGDTIPAGAVVVLDLSSAE